MVLTSLPDGSISFDCVNQASFHQVYNLGIGAESLAKQPPASLEQLITDLQNGVYGAYCGYIFRDETISDPMLSVVYDGVIAAGGDIVIGENFHGMIYKKNATVFHVKLCGSCSEGERGLVPNFEIKSRKLNFESLLPTQFPMTAGARLMGGCPDDYVVVDGKTFEHYQQNGVTGYPSADYGVIVNSRLVKAFGIQTGGWNLDYLPTSKLGGVKSILSPARCYSKAKKYDADEGIYVMSSSEVDAAVASLRQGNNLIKLKSLGVVYNRPISGVYSDSGLLYVAALPSYENYVKFNAKFGVVDPYDNGTFSGKNLTDAVRACINAGNATEGEMDELLLRYSYILFNSEEVLDELRKYQSVYNEYIIKAGKAARAELFDAGIAYNAAVVDAYSKYCSLGGDGTTEESKAFRKALTDAGYGILYGMDMPLPFEKPLVDPSRANDIDISDGAKTISTVIEVFKYFQSQSHGYIGTRPSTEEEHEEGRYFPVTFNAKEVDDAFHDAVSQIRSTFLKKFVPLGYGLCGLPGPDGSCDGWMNSPANQGSNHDTDSYDHGCGDVCDFGSDCFPYPTQYRATMWKEAFDGNGNVVDMYDDPSKRTFEVAAANGTSIFSLRVKNLKVLHDELQVDAEIMMRAGYAHLYSGLWSAQSNCNKVNRLGVENCIDTMGLGDYAKVTYIGQSFYSGKLPRMRSYDKDWCRKRTYTFYGPCDYRNLVQPALFCINIYGLSIYNQVLTLPTKTTANFEVDLQTNVTALLSDANKAAIKYLIDALNSLGILSSCTFCGTSASGEIVELNTLTSCTNFVLANGKELVDNLRKIADAKEINSVREPDDYAGKTSNEEGNYVIQQRSTILALAVQLESITGPKSKVWYSPASSVCSVKRTEEYDIIPYVCKV